MKYKTIILIILWIPFFSACQNCKYEITQLIPYFDIEKSIVDTNKFRYFMVKNFCNDTNVHINIFKDFAIKNIDQDYKKYDNYVIQFYHGSQEFNRDFLSDTLSDIKSQGKYLLFNFFWKKGQYSGFEHYVDGSLINYRYE